MDQKLTGYFMGKVSETGELLLSEHQIISDGALAASGRNLQKVRDMIGNHAPLKMLPITVCRCTVALFDVVHSEDFPIKMLHFTKLQTKAVKCQIGFLFSMKNVHPPDVLSICDLSKVDLNSL